MIFSFENAIEFKKFAIIFDKSRYTCFRVDIHGFYALRSIKTNRNLDTAVYKGNESKDLDSFLDKRFDIILVSEIAFMKE